MPDAQWAINLLGDENFKKIVIQQKDRYINDIVNSDVADSETREICFLKIKVLDELVSSIESISQNAEIKEKRWKIL